MLHSTARCVTENYDISLKGDVETDGQNPVFWEVDVRSDREVDADGNGSDDGILLVPQEQPQIQLTKQFRQTVQWIGASHFPRCNLESAFHMD